MKKAFFAVVLALVVFGLASCEHIGVRENESQNDGMEIALNVNGDTLKKEFRKDGSLRSIVTVKNGKRNGPSYVYYENGKLQFEINYKNSVKNGITKYFYENGALYRTTLFENGDKVGIQKYYHEKGGLKAEIPYEFGSVVPGTKEYSQSGKLLDDYPEIVVKTVDKLAFENTYELKISLSPFKKNADIYFDYVVDGKHVQRSTSHGTENGVATHTYFVYPGQSLMEKLEIRCRTKSRRGMPVVLTKTYNLVVDNRNY